MRMVRRDMNLFTGDAETHIKQGENNLSELDQVA